MYFNDVITRQPSLSITAEAKIDEEEKEPKNESSKEDLELPTFDLATILDATDNFSLNQKIGEGGFGPVYKVHF